ncbi:hypothetical protein NPIL_117411 [Nephila pilipes]|uniref:Uncharacterized protein n=1 Tax=Nephila pilipes TaxID=299642 RepID=A0A8X6QWJ5_NEPPI|nr:hypothetical protein NPIL_117411 [Nephila pilipes]
MAAAKAAAGVVICYALLPCRFAAAAFMKRSSNGSQRAAGAAALYKSSYMASGAVFCCVAWQLRLKQAKSRLYLYTYKRYSQACALSSAVLSRAVYCYATA